MFEVEFPDAIGGGYTLLMKPSEFYPLINATTYTITLTNGDIVAFSKNGKRLIYRFVIG